MSSAHRPAQRRPPCLGQDSLSDAVQLADVAEGEGGQERAEGGGSHDPVAEHSGGLPSAQHVGVVDAVGAGHHRVDQGQHLAAGPVGAGAVTEVDQLIDDRLDPQRLGQRGRQQQPGVATAWSSSNTAPSPAGLWEDGIEKAPSSSGPMDVSATPFSLLRGPFS
jgi:hypothetical protein